MKKIVFGVPPFLLYHRSGFHSPQPWTAISPSKSSGENGQPNKAQPFVGSIAPGRSKELEEYLALAQRWGP